MIKAEYLLIIDAIFRKCKKNTKGMGCVNINLKEKPLTTAKGFVFENL